jgi:hypothetical protein
MLISSAALRLSESSGTTWWLVSVPAGTEASVAAGLCEQLGMLEVPVRSIPGDPNPDARLIVFVVDTDDVSALAGLLDKSRSLLAGQGVLALVIAEPNVRPFLQAAPHVASFIGGKVIECDDDDEEAPPEIKQRRLESLRETYGITDAEAREIFRTGQAPEGIDFLEWMVLLGDSKGERS